MIEMCWHCNKQPLLLCSGGYCLSMENELVFAVANICLKLLAVKVRNGQHLFNITDSQ